MKLFKHLKTFFICLIRLLVWLALALWSGTKTGGKFIKNWNEFVTIPIAFTLFWFARPLLRWVDPTSGVFDAGVLHVFFAGLVIYLLSIAAIWLLIRLTYKFLYVYLDVQIEIDFKTLTNFQKCVLSLGFFSVLLLGFAITLASL